MAESADIRITGVKETVRAIQQLPRDMMVEVKEKVLRRAAKPLVNLAKAYSHRYKDTGLFQESIGMKLWPDTQTREMFNVVMAIVGARRGSRFEGRANIAHLLEKGWRVARGGTLERESGRAAPVSSVTGERGKGVAVGYVPGLHMFARAAKAGAPMAMAIIKTETPRVAKRVWNRRRRAGR